MDKNQFEDRPNLLRVTTELSKCKNPDRVLEVLKFVLIRQAPEDTAQS